MAEPSQPAGPLSLPPPELLARTVRRIWASRDRADPTGLHHQLELIGSAAREVGGRQMLMRIVGLATNAGPGRPRNVELWAVLMEAWRVELRSPGGTT